MSRPLAFTGKSAVSGRLLLLCLLWLFPPDLSAQPILSLEGRWGFALDPDDRGETEGWFEKALSDSILLPGTTDLRQKGHPLDPGTMTYGVEVLRTLWPGTAPVARADRAGHLVRDWYYVGKAWYQRDIEIPESWAEKIIHLKLERVLWESTVWIDGRRVGKNDSLVAAHEYELGRLQPGSHRLSIRVDNGMIHNIGIIGHAYGPETQSRWNGIVGEIELQATEAIFLDDLQVYPASDRESVRLMGHLISRLEEDVEGELSIEVRDGRRLVGSDRIRLSVEAASEKGLDRRIDLQEPGRPWSEFEPVRYQVTAEWRSDDGIDRRAIDFGFRHIRRNNRSILINETPVFLRGTLDCAIYPRTGHPPMGIEEWLETLETIKGYGFNHVRFHSWCPPRAAFEAADRLGVYLAPETPFWVDNWTTETSSLPRLLGKDPEVVEYVRREIHRISEAYGNHPSFALFCIGNEFGLDSDWELINQLLVEAKERDPRRLYNATTARRRVPSDDYWVTHTTGTARTRGVGPASTDWDFSTAVGSVDLPLIAHETGQRPVYPNFSALFEKLIGPLKPYYLERLQRDLESSGQAGQRADFERASGSFQQVLYKSEHEAMRRTADLAGYQLLMLNDFPGQSTALVGILDPFWEPKRGTDQNRVLDWNRETAILARFPRYVWSSDEALPVRFELSHFGPQGIASSVLEWRLMDREGETVQRGTISTPQLGSPGLHAVGEFETPLADFPAPSALRLEARMGALSNRWNLWVYPAAAEQVEADLLISRRLDDATRQALQEGRRVLLLANGIEGPLARPTTFLPVYWSAAWWGNPFSSLGLLCNPDHPALGDFPNDGHSDWQWFELTEGATTFLLDEAPRDVEIIVQAVPDFHYNSRLAHLFEARVGRGKLLVCGFDLSSELDSRPAARQFRRSLLHYMNGDRFEPRADLSPELLLKILP